MRKIGFLVFFSLVLIFITSGCLGRNIGGRLFPVLLSSEPSGATAYVIPWDIWLKNGGTPSCIGCDKIITANRMLDRYRVKEGLTNIQIMRPSKSYIMIAEYKGIYEISNRFTPGRVSRINLTIPTYSR